MAVMGLSGVQIAIALGAKAEMINSFITDSDETLALL